MLQYVLHYDIGRERPSESRDGCDQHLGMEVTSSAENEIQLQELPQQSCPASVREKKLCWITRKKGWQKETVSPSMTPAQALCYLLYPQICVWQLMHYPTEQSQGGYFHRWTMIIFTKIFFRGRGTQHVPSYKAEAPALSPILKAMEHNFFTTTTSYVNWQRAVSKRPRFYPELGPWFAL